ncbi:MAG TPA: autotransporter outer membrane beta-barrel domain-containing protein [Luteibacter sp.]|uniref:autotransporter family protein n=1 Tax=Luteibacter sp. TaxID=1886636 RepID=UPI002C96C190|nr:autotransporter outer membrane beta-barrel domain-containing protein [Luteibacter sp.]HVI55925.1 autotransporter outer membrane beta-barrel domain-containing protein [Luteibacter sp.]
MSTEKLIKTRHMVAILAAFAQPAMGAEGPPWVVDGGDFDLPAGSWQTTSPDVPALWLKGGATATVSNATLKTSGKNAHAIRTEGVGGALTLSGTGLHTSGVGAYGLRIDGAGPTKLTDVTLSTEGGGAYGARFGGANVEGRIVGGSVTTTGYAAIGILAEDGAQFSVDSTSISTGNKAAHGLAAHGPSAALRAVNATIETRGEGANGVLVSRSVTAVLTDTSITTGGDGASAMHASEEAGLVTITGGRWRTTGRQAAGFEGANRSLAKMSGTFIETVGFNAAGIHAKAGSLSMSDVDIVTHGNQSFGIVATGTDYPDRPPSVDATRTRISTGGETANGADAREGARITLDDTDIGTTGKYANGLSAWKAAIVVNRSTIRAAGVAAYGADVSEGGSLTMQGGTIESVQAAALRLYNPTRVRIGGAATLGGVAFVDVYPTSTLPFTVVLEGKSQATGDIRLAQTTGTPVPDATKASLSLRSGAVWQGGTDIVRDLTLEDAGQWSMTRQSLVGKLSSDHGVVTFASAPGTFTTLTIAGDYNGNQGLFRMRSRLGDDTSASDLLHIMGNTSGNSFIAVDALDGAGDYTKDGIRLVQVDGSSDGQFELAGRVVAGAHEYFLYQGALNAANDGHWYLRSSLEPETVDPTIVDPPVTPETPEPEVDPDPVVVLPRVLRPEVGAYRANQTAALEMFQGGPGAGEDDERDGARHGVWARFDRRHTRFDIGRELTTTSSANELTLGADLLRRPDDEAHLGIMAAVGRADTRGTSLLTRYAARGRVRGAAAGVYGGFRGDDGTYVRGWAQYAHVNQRVEGDALAAERYGTGMLTASVEAGHRWRHALNRSTDTYIEPQAQILMTRLRGGTHREVNGTRIAPLHGTGATARIGVRAAARWNTPNGHVASPYLAANWIRRLGHLDATTFNTEAYDAGVPRNSYGLKLGVALMRRSGWRLWTDVETRFGAHRYRRVVGSIGIRKVW